jgi:transcriptional regulator with XRE-family HTH domain
MNILGEAITKIRQEKNISQKELAHTIGIAPSYMSDIERGRRNPKMNLLACITYVLYHDNKHDYSDFYLFEKYIEGMEQRLGKLYLEALESYENTGGNNLKKQTKGSLKTETESKKKKAKKPMLKKPKLKGVEEKGGKKKK